MLENAVRPTVVLVLLKGRPLTSDKQGSFPAEQGLVETQRLILFYQRTKLRIHFGQQIYHLFQEIAISDLLMFLCSNAPTRVVNFLFIKWTLIPVDWNKKRLILFIVENC